jgi:Phosphotransferase enzyme family
MSGLGPADWAAVAERFGLGPPSAVPSYVTRGAMGEIWRLETARGRWAVKWQFPWAPTEARPADLRVQAAAVEAGIPLPPPVSTPSGDAVIAVGDRHVRVYRWLDLRPPIQAPAPPELAAEAGRLLGLLHRLAWPADGPIDPWYTTPPSPGAWDTLAERAAAAAASWAAKLASARPKIADLGKLVGPATGRPAIICHRDFTPDNVLPARSGLPVLPELPVPPELAVPPELPGLPVRPGALVVLDWENAGPMDPERELGSAVLAWAAGRRFDATAAQRLLDGYAGATSRPTTLRRDLFSETVVVHLNFLHVMGNQAIDEPEHRGYAEEQIASMLDHDLDDLRANITAAEKALNLPD